MEGDDCDKAVSVCAPSPARPLKHIIGKSCLDLLHHIMHFLLLL